MSESEAYHAIAIEARRRAEVVRAEATHLRTMSARVTRILGGTATRADTAMIARLDAAAHGYHATAAALGHAAVAAARAASEAEAKERQARGTGTAAAGRR
ncbi:MAG: hypothetical protein IPH27_11405 [Actinomycetales bacterium]|jgi:hypothetical protein|nr:hypothetical protein [Candidatus Phosphoribacter baldrii]MBK6956017.1 hypothetical protein [Candidatus Phosphoribacter baldrii]